MISAHRSTILGFILGAFLVSVAILALSARADVATADARSPDPVVASDHALRTVATVAPADAPDPPPSVLDRALDIAGPVGRGALGGIACLAVAWLLARARERWGWLRRGWAGNAAATAYAALTAFGATLAIGGSVGVGLTVVGGAMVTGMAIARDPATARAPFKAPPRTGEIPTEDVPT